MTAVESSDIWMGMKGYGGMTMQMSARTAVKTVFTRKSDASIRWHGCPIHRRPSATTSGMWEKSLSASTISETLRAAADPEAMATEQSASRRARTSFTPSPVMATSVPAPVQGAHEVALLLRRDAPEHARLVDGGVELLGRVERRGVHVALGMRDAGAHGDGRDRAGVVPGDDPELDPLVEEEPHGLGSGGADLVADGDAPHQAHLADKRVLVVESVGLAHHEHALRSVEGPRDPVRLLHAVAAEHEGGGAHHERAAILGHAAGVLARRVEGDGARRARRARTPSAPAWRRRASAVSFGVLGVCGRYRGHGGLDVAL